MLTSTKGPNYTNILLNQVVLEKWERKKPA